MAKYGDKIYFGKCVNGSVDTVWVAGVVAEDVSDAIEKIKSNIDDEEMELVTLSIDACFYADMELLEQLKYKENDFFLYDPDSLS